MKRPKLTDQKYWTPFDSVPVVDKFYVQEKIAEIPHFPLTRKERIRNNSFYLDLFLFLLFCGITYFFYLVYVERKSQNDDHVIDYDADESTDT